MSFAEGGDWVLNGTKHFISHADIADFAIVFMASGEEETPRGRKKRITAFFVDKGTPGFTVEEPYDKLGWHISDTHGLSFDGCRVPADHLVGTEGQGFRQLMATFESARIQTAARACGVAQAAIRANPWS